MSGSPKELEIEEIILDCPGEPSVITGVIIRERQGRSESERLEDARLLALKMEDGALS